MGRNLQYQKQFTKTDTVYSSARQLALGSPIKSSPVQLQLQETLARDRKLSRRSAMNEWVISYWTVAETSNDWWLMIDDWFLLLFDSLIQFAVLVRKVSRCCNFKLWMHAACIITCSTALGMHKSIMNLSRHYLRHFTIWIAIVPKLVIKTCMNDCLLALLRRNADFKDVFLDDICF